MQMKSILKEWRQRLNEVVVDHPIEETYEKITDWAARVNTAGERLNIKTPPGVKPEEAIIAMFTDLQPKVSRVDKEGAVTKITFDDVSVDVLAPYFDADWQSGEEVSTAEGSLISLTSFNPQGGQTVIRISGNLKDRKGNALLATVDPATGKDVLRAPLNEREGESAALEIEFDGHDIDVSGDEITWYFKVDGYDIEIPTIRNFDAVDIAWQLITKLEDDERFPGVDSDDEAQVDAIERQVDTPEFQADAKEASAEANEQAAQHWEGRKKDSPLLKLIKEELKKALREQPERMVVACPGGGTAADHPGGQCPPPEMDEQAGKEPSAEELVVAEVERDKKFKFPEPLRTNIKGVLAKSKPSYLRAKQWVSAKADQELKKKGGKGRGGGKGPVKTQAVAIDGDKCVFRGKVIGDLKHIPSRASPEDYKKCMAKNMKPGKIRDFVSRQCRDNADKKLAACQAMASKARAA